MSTIKLEALTAREIFDGRGDPALEVTARLADGSTGTARVPGGEPEEPRETKDLRDHDPRRYGGRGVTKAVRNVHAIIAPALAGSSPVTLREADHLLRTLDSTPDCSRLGANTLLGVSLACGKALAVHYGMELCRFLGGEAAGRLPVPWIPFPCGGWQGYLAPVGAGCFEEGVRWCGEVLRRLDAPETLLPEAHLAQAAAAIESAGHAGRVKLALRPRGHFVPGEAGYRLPGVVEPLPSEEMRDYWAALGERLPLWELAAPLAPTDAEGWGELAERLQSRVRLAGDTSLGGLPGLPWQDAWLFPHHFGTVTDLLEQGQRLREAGVGVLLAAAPGETEDDAFADLAVAMAARQVIPGPLRGAEHLCKINRFLALEGK